MDEGEVVGGSVVLVEFPRRRPHQSTDREIETRRAELAFIPAPGLELVDPVLIARVTKDVHRRSIDLGIPPSALLIGDHAGIPDARSDEAMANEREPLLVPREPGE